MREGLDAPTLELPAENVEQIRAFLDGQSRLKLAVWVRHEQQGGDGPLYDHHLVLGVDDGDWETGDMRALDAGVWRHLPLRTTEKTWIDIYPLSEVEGLRSLGTVLWEQASPGADPLDYRFTFQPFEAVPEAVARFVSLVGAFPAVRSVGADVSRFWNGDDEVESTIRLAVDAPAEADVREVVDAARSTVLAGHSFRSPYRGPVQPSMTILYEAST